MSSEERLQDELEKLFDVIRTIGLKPEWALCIVSLALQEIAIKKKLEELGEAVIYESDFQAIAEQLEKAYKNRDLECPLILMSIIRSERHIRAKLIHEGHHYEVSEGDCRAIINNTISLIDSLFPSYPENIPGILERLKICTDESIGNVLSELDSEVVNALIKGILDKMVLSNSWSDVREQKYLYIVLDKSLKIGTNTDKIRRYSYIIEPLLNETLGAWESRVLEIVKSISNLSFIQQWILKNNIINGFIEFFGFSHQFIDAARRSELIFNLSSLMNVEQLNRVLDVSIKNKQIYGSWRAQEILNKLISKFKTQLDASKIKELEEKMKE